MLHHASRRADITSTPLLSILQAAAGRAWVRTRPARSFHRAIPRSTVAVAQAERKAGESSTGVVAHWAFSLRSVEAARIERTPPAANPNLYEGFEPQDWLENGASVLDHAPADAHSAESAPISDPNPEDIPLVAAVPEVEEHITPPAPVVPEPAAAVVDDPPATAVPAARHDVLDEALPEYEDDPPWDGPRWDDVLHELDDPPILAIPCTDPTIRVAKTPTSRSGLYQHLLYLAYPQSTGSTRPLTLLLRYHETYSEFQSTASYNFLMSLAIGTGEFDTAWGLLTTMVERGFGNMETRMLRARLQIRQGLWEQTWEEEHASGPIPLPIWLEFLGAAHYNIPPMLDAKAAEERSRVLAQLRTFRTSLQAEDTDAAPIPEASPEPPDSVQAEADASSTQLEPEDESMQGFADLNASYGDWGSSPNMARVDVSYLHPVLGTVVTPGSEDPALSQEMTDGDDQLWKKRSYADRTDDEWHPPEKAQEPLPEATAVAVDEGRYDTLMRNPPALTPEQSANMPPRVTLMLVRCFMRTNKPQVAFDATQAYFTNLPPKLTPALQRACMNIVHAQLVVAKPSLSAHHRARKTLARLLRLHAALRPNATTLLYLVNSLRATKQCGTEAMTLAQEFRRRFGADVVDERVRWRLAWLALKERNLRHAERVFAEHDAARARAAQEDLLRETHAQRGPGGKMTRPSFSEILPARDLEEYWIPLRNRLEQLRARKKTQKRKST